MSKINEIRKDLFKCICKQLEKVHSNLNNFPVKFAATVPHKFPFSYTLMEAIDDTKKFIMMVNLYNNQSTEDVIYNNKELAKNIEKLNRIIPLRDLFVEAHFLVKSIEEDSIHPTLHNMYKKQKHIKISVKGSGTYVVEEVDETIATYLLKVAKEKYNGDLSAIGDYFTKVEEPKYANIKTIYDNMLAKKPNPLSNKKIIKNCKY
ncbi:MAG: hypothetical protein E7184_04025 [Erysipelotrichaceae bacterium]|nr:hypothetical protein [Erysipelotrichaceae bacterium]